MTPNALIRRAKEQAIKAKFIASYPQEHEDTIDGVLGLCSVPMWLNGCPAGTCGNKAYGVRPPSRMWMNYSAGRMMREDLIYDGYVPGLACSGHGGPEVPNQCYAAPTPDNTP